MKQILSILIVALIIGCGGGDKKTKENKQPSTLTYSYIAPTQEMLISGETTFRTSCYICHKNSVGEVIMLTDKSRWIENSDKNLEVFVQHVHDGYTGDYGTMPPKGACMDCSKDDLRNTIIYMMTETGVLQ